jgi:hypothetical protein
MPAPGDVYNEKVGTEGNSCFSGDVLLESRTEK